MSRTINAERYKNAKLNADLLNNAVKDLNKFVLSVAQQQLDGNNLTDTQIITLHNLTQAIERLSDSADRSWELYQNYCERNNYKVRNIQYDMNYSFN